MADRVNASITIGGRVKDVEALVDAIEAEDLGPDWDLRFDSRQDIYDLLARATKPVFLARHEVTGGSFDVLQAECEAQQLTYLLEYDGYGGCWGPGVHIFEPASGTRCFSQESDGGAICINAHAIRAREFDSVQQLLDFLDEAAKFEPPPLRLRPDISKALTRADQLNVRDTERLRDLIDRDDRRIPSAHLETAQILLGES